MWGWKGRAEGRMWTDERDTGDQVIPYWRDLKTLRKGLFLCGNPRISWDHPVLLKRTFSEQDLVQVLLLAVYPPMKHLL